MKKLRAETPEGLPMIVGLLRGQACDMREVALDEQEGNLHVPVPGGELIVRRVIEFTLGNIVGVRRFEIEDLAYDDASGQLSIRSEQAERFLLTVDRVDVVLSLA